MQWRFVRIRMSFICTTTVNVFRFRDGVLALWQRTICFTALLEVINLALGGREGLLTFGVFY